MNGVGLSASTSLSRVCAIDTDRPSLTSAAASRRLAGVIRLKVPISSVAPQRPQFEMSFIICTTSARVGFGGGAAPCASTPGSRVERAVPSTTTPTPPRTNRVMRTSAPARSISPGAADA